MSIVDMIRPARRNFDRPADPAGRPSWRRSHGATDPRDEGQRRWDWMSLLAYGAIGR